jgi:hypothetical protein
LINIYENYVPDQIEDNISIYNYSDYNQRSMFISTYNAYMKVIKDIRKRTKKAHISIS